MKLLSKKLYNVDRNDLGKLIFEAKFSHYSYTFDVKLYTYYEHLTGVFDLSIKGFITTEHKGKKHTRTHYYGCYTYTDEEKKYHWTEKHYINIAKGFSEYAYEIRKI